MKKSGLDDLPAAIISCTNPTQHSLKIIFLLSMTVGLRHMRCAVDVSFGLTFKRILSPSKFRMICLLSLYIDNQRITFRYPGPKIIERIRGTYSQKFCPENWFEVPYEKNLYYPTN